MNNSEKIRSVIESQLTDSEFLVDIVIKGTTGTQKLIALIDDEKGITIERCAKISRELSKFLDDNELFESTYTLEVSSPGLDHPLKLKRQYIRNIGRTLKLSLVDGQEKEGILRGITEDIIEMEMIQKNGKHQDNMVRIPFNEIDKAMVLVSFSKQG